MIAPQPVAVADGRPQPGREPKQRAVRSGTLLTRLASMSSAKESKRSPFALRNRIAASAAPRVLRGVEERRQVPGDHPHPGGVGGVDELAERVPRTRSVALLVVAGLQIERLDAVPGHRRHLPPRMRPVRRCVDVEPRPQPGIRRADAKTPPAPEAGATSSAAAQPSRAEGAQLGAATPGPAAHRKSVPDPTRAPRPGRARGGSCTTRPGTGLAAGGAKVRAS